MAQGPRVSGRQTARRPLATRRSVSSPASTRVRAARTRTAARSRRKAQQAPRGRDVTGSPKITQVPSSGENFGQRFTRAVCSNATTQAPQLQAAASACRGPSVRPRIASTNRRVQRLPPKHRRLGASPASKRTILEWTSPTPSCCWRRCSKGLHCHVWHAVVTPRDGAPAARGG